jgi:hypothetical protein
MFGGDVGLGKENAKGLFDRSGAGRVNLTPSPGSTSQADTVVAAIEDFFVGLRGAAIEFSSVFKPSDSNDVTVALNGRF